MLQLAEINYWSLIINLMIENFFQNGTTICILWSKSATIDWQLDLNHQTHTFVHIKNENLKNYHSSNIYDFEAKQKFLDDSGFENDELLLKFAASFELNYCEGFLAFEEDIPVMVEQVTRANLVSEWHSIRNQFIFCFCENYYENIKDVFRNKFFEDQADVLVIEAVNSIEDRFRLKTNQITKTSNTSIEPLNLIQEIDVKNLTFVNLNQLKVNKTNNLKQRVITIGAFDYRPFIALDYQLQPQMYDHAPNNPSKAIHADGTEIRVIITFCELYNCTVEMDSSQDDWGEFFLNGTGGFGLLGLLADYRVDIAVCAFYDFGLKTADFSAFLGRSGVTAIVPAPQRLVSWQLPLLPFQKLLWLAVLCLLLLETVSLLITKKIEEDLIYETSGTWRESILFAYRTTLQLLISQSTTYTTNENSLRILLISCYMIDIIITATYGGGLATVLTLPTLEKAPDSVERMAEFNLKWSAQTEYFVTVVQETKDPTIQKIIRNFEVLSVDEMRERSKNGNQGFVVERLVYGHFGNVDYISLADLDRYKLMIDDIYFDYTGAYVRRSWSLEESLNQFIYWWHSGGLAQYWESKIAADYMNKIKQERIASSKHIKPPTGPVKLDIANFVGLIIIWITGMSLSTLVFFIELYIHYKQKK